MVKTDLTCLLFPDLLPWERSAVLPLINELSESHRVVQIELGRGRKVNWKRIKNSEAIWVLSGDWRRVLAYLSRLKGKKLYLSIFSLGNIHQSLPTLFVRKFYPLISESVQIIVHSQLTYRFFREIEGVPEKQLSYLHLPHPEGLTPLTARERRKREFYTVGTFAPLVSESNYNYFLGVAHYVCQRETSVNFHIMGSGILLKHVSKIIQGLELVPNVKIIRSPTGDDIRNQDLVLFTPVRNDHFIPILFAAVTGRPVLASFVPGIEDYIKDGRDGFIMPVNEIKPMGEMILRFINEKRLGTTFGNRIKKKFTENFSAKTLADSYGNLFFRAQQAIKPLTEAA